MGLAAIIEESLNEVYVFETETYRFVEVNRGARDNLGYSMDELRELTPWDLKPEYDRETFESFVEPLRSGEVSRLEFTTIHRRKDDSTYPVIVSLQKSELMGREVFAAIILDVTEQQQLERQLRQAQKLESIGSLAAGVAHEINTPLQYIGNNIQYLSGCMSGLVDLIDETQSLLSGAETISTDERQRRYSSLLQSLNYETIRREMPEAITESEDGIGRVLTIIKALREFSHMGEEAMKEADLNHAVESTLAVTKNHWKDAASVRFSPDPGLPHVECNESEIQQVLLNLVVNAVDAVESNQSAGQGVVSISTACEGESVLIEVRDNGCGMDDWTLERIFDPFFTTKEVGKGTGQGLAICHRIICQQHQGSLTASSELGEGAVFRVSLPIKQSQHARVSEPDSGQLTRTH